MSDAGIVLTHKVRQWCVLPIPHKMLQRKPVRAHHKRVHFHGAQSKDGKQKKKEEKKTLNMIL